MAQTIQSHPATSGPQHETTCARNSTSMWPITMGLYRRLSALRTRNRTRRLTNSGSSLCQSHIIFLGFDKFAQPAFGTDTNLSGVYLKLFIFCLTGIGTHGLGRKYPACAIFPVSPPKTDTQQQITLDKDTPRLKSQGE